MTQKMTQLMRICERKTQTRFNKNSRTHTQVRLKRLFIKAGYLVGFSLSGMARFFNNDHSSVMYHRDLYDPVADSQAVNIALEFEKQPEHAEQVSGLQADKFLKQVARMQHEFI